MNSDLTGKTIRIIGNTAGHNIPTGTICEVVQHHSDNNDVLVRVPNSGIRTGQPQTRTVYVSDYVLCPITREELTKQKGELEIKLKDLTIKIKDMDKYDMKEYNDEDYKILKAIEAFSNEGTLMEKAKRVKEVLGK